MIKTDGYSGWFAGMRRLSRIIQAAAALLVVFTFFSSHYGVPVRTTLPAAQMSAGTGYEYIADFPDQRLAGLLEVPSDNLDNNARSTLRLFEDGVELGPPHSPHINVRFAGKGAFSHWAGTVHFSSSDGTDPRTSGRSYTARYRLYPGRWVWYLTVLVAALGAACFIGEVLAALKGFSIREHKQEVARFFSAGSLARLAGLCVLYTFAMMLVLAAIDARNESGNFKINFEYKVF